jgi:hypothetical protein
MITGSDSMLTGSDSPMDGIIAEILVSVPAVSIAGGTDEIQKILSRNGYWKCRRRPDLIPDPSKMYPETKPLTRPSR